MLHCAAGGCILRVERERETPVLLPGIPASSAELPKGRPRRWTAVRLECKLLASSPAQISQVLSLLFFKLIS